MDTESTTRQSELASDVYDCFRRMRPRLVQRATSMLGITSGLYGNAESLVDNVPGDLILYFKRGGSVKVSLEGLIWRTTINRVLEHIRSTRFMYRAFLSMVRYDGAKPVSVLTVCQDPFRMEALLDRCLADPRFKGKDKGIIALLYAGYPYNRICNILGITEREFKRIRNRLFEKFLAALKEY